MQLEALVFLLVVGAVVGSTFGISAAVQVGALTRRLAMLEAQLAVVRALPQSGIESQVVARSNASAVPYGDPDPQVVARPDFAADRHVTHPHAGAHPNAVAPPRPPVVERPQIVAQPSVVTYPHVAAQPNIARQPHVTPAAAELDAGARPDDGTPPGPRAVERPRDRALRDDLVRGVIPTGAPAPAQDTIAADWWRAFELRAGTRWITWLGAAALVIGAALFLKLAIDEGWLGPIARLSLGAAGGVGLLVAGRWAHRFEMRPLAQGLFGAGLGVLYVVTYIAFSTHGLIARELAFAAMVGITVAGCFLALRHDAQAVATLALIGGLVTPVAVSSGSGGRDELCLYLLVLDLGALVIAFARGWRALEMTAVVGTWVLFGGWLDRHHDAATWPVELAWLAVFHGLFLAMPFARRSWRTRRELIAEERFVVATVGAVVAFALAAVIVEVDRERLGAIALVMAAGYAAVAAIADAKGLHRGFLLLAIALVTLAVPLVLDGPGITIAWAIEAPILLALGQRWHQPAIRYVGLGVLGLAACHAGAAYATHDPGAAFANTRFASALVVAAAAGVFTLASRRAQPAEHWLGMAAGLGGTAFALVVTHVELGGISRQLTPLVWAAGASVAIAVASRLRDRSAFAGAAAFAAIAAVNVLHLYGTDAGLARLFAALVTISVVAALATTLRRCGEVAGGRAAWVVALAGLGCVIGAEAGAHHHALLSIAWAAYAAALLAVGFARRIRALRLGGLGLLGLVAAKLVLHDLAGAAPMHRVLSFLVVGALMIAASFAYHQLERRQ